MTSFIAQILQEYLKSGVNISETIFILPSRRAGSFLLNELAKLSGQNLFAPKTYSIEEFAQEVSGLDLIGNTNCLFEFYEVYYEKTKPENRESFETFIAWAQTLLHDFNEIDRYLIDYKKFFNYLAEIQDINHWYLQAEKTELIQNYLKFWHKLPEYYEGLKERLDHKQQAYQGLIYREAASNISTYCRENQQKHVFLGFNALNNAEQEIIQYMLAQENTEIHWDLDDVFLADKTHSASMFISEYLKKWSFYEHQKAKSKIDVFRGKKNINVIGTAKNVGQAKYLGEILANFSQDQLEKTAVVLGEEDLLLPVLNSLPPNVEDLNITMGFPLKNAPLASLFEKIFHIHLNEKNGYYYKDVISIINHPALYELLRTEAEKFNQKLSKENTVYLSAKEIIPHFEKTQDLIKACFIENNDHPESFIAQIQITIQMVKKSYEKQQNRLGLEFLYRFHQVFNKLQTLLQDYPHIKSLKSMHVFYREMMSTENLNFQGRPFKGLQLMGMLESRALDFETVIITSVNEGILPSGKSNNSFLPFELKQQYKLPTYREKNAVYTYHFYRLLQRAKNVYLLYNTEPDGLNNGEKSRFITQLEIENQPAHQLKKIQVSPQVPAIKQEMNVITKTPAIIERLKEIAARGFSPSALTTYVRNPIDFYSQYILKIKDPDVVEETVAYNTLGTVIHDSLENFYKPLEGKILTQSNIEGFIQKIPEEVALQFQNSYSPNPMKYGKNLLIFEVAKRYLYNFLNEELTRIKNGAVVEILMIEKKLDLQLRIPGLDFPVKIGGKVDRVENVDGITRIVDYKTGKVLQNQLEVVDWDLLTTDYDKYSKSFQVLTYASIISGNLNLLPPVEAGVISFKNLKSGFLKFAKKDASRSKNKKTEVDAETLEAFQQQLKALIIEICNPEIAFVEKEIKNGNY